MSKYFDDGSLSCFVNVRMASSSSIAYRVLGTGSNFGMVGMVTERSGTGSDTDLDASGTIGFLGGLAFAGSGRLAGVASGESGCERLSRMPPDDRYAEMSLGTSDGLLGLEKSVSPTESADAIVAGSLSVRMWVGCDTPLWRVLYEGTLGIRSGCKPAPPDTATGGVGGGGFERTVAADTER